LIYRHYQFVQYFKIIACRSSFFKTAGVYLQNIHPHVEE
jgi:hypothetical protein